MIINYNNFKTVKRNNKLSSFINQLTKANSEKVVNDEVALSNHIQKNITYLEDEIITTLKDKLDEIKDNVNEVKYNTFKNKYLDEVKKDIISSSKCDYNNCYLKLREVSDLLSGVNYYIENDSLVVYRSFQTYSIYDEQDYFTRADFRFLIK